MREKKKNKKENHVNETKGGGIVSFYGFRERIRARARAREYYYPLDATNVTVFNVHFVVRDCQSRAQSCLHENSRVSVAIVRTEDSKQYILQTLLLLKRIEIFYSGTFHSFVSISTEKEFYKCACYQRRI